MVTALLAILAVASVPDEILLAFRAVNEAPEPENVVAVAVPVIVTPPEAVASLALPR